MKYQYGVRSRVMTHKLAGHGPYSEKKRKVRIFEKKIQGCFRTSKTDPKNEIFLICNFFLKNGYFFFEKG